MLTRQCQYVFCPRPLNFNGNQTFIGYQIHTNTCSLIYAYISIWKLANRAEAEVEAEIHNIIENLWATKPFRTDD